MPLLHVHAWPAQGTKVVDHKSQLIVGLGAFKPGELEKFQEEQQREAAEKAAKAAGLPAPVSGEGGHCVRVRVPAWVCVRVQGVHACACACAGVHAYACANACSCKALPLANPLL